MLDFITADMVWGFIAGVIFSALSLTVVIIVGLRAINELAEESEKGRSCEG